MSGRCGSPPPTTGGSAGLPPEVWLLCERDLGTTPRTKYYLVNLPVTASLKVIVRIAHHRFDRAAVPRAPNSARATSKAARSPAGTHPSRFLTAITYNFDCKPSGAGDESHSHSLLPAIVQEIFDGLTLFAHRPQYLKRIQTLRTVKLQI